MACPTAHPGHALYGGRVAQTTAWQALADRRFLRTSWPWRAAAYLLTGALTGAVTLVLLPLALPLLPSAERRRLRVVDPVPAAGAHRPPGAPGLGPWARTRLAEPATWRELAYGLLTAFVLWPLELLAVVFALVLPLQLIAAPVMLAADGEQVNILKAWPATSYPVAVGAAAVGLVLLPVAAYALTALAGARGALARALLAARPGEDERIGELTSSRRRLADSFEAERRRIERDLHDGAQQRLVALTISLGLARLDAEPGSPLAARLAEAQDEAGRALAELRDLVNGIHPRVLTDRGLSDALADAADRCPVPVDLAVDLPAARLPEAVEAGAYFAVCEALANVAKHSGAGRAALAARHDGRRLLVEVRDDGRGGADPAHGTGLTGLADRVAVLEGALTLASPPGGPTLLRMEFPCA